ncbi:MAG: GNAT family N-acetyltransferase [Dehalococcoidia bacterium]|nr:GNAT family N-acetyltransferase [Dehalococcoidia bacterium]MYA51958.1 GNAT family N-acetyltransferase [Dehalococcoidia bacterium]
MSRFAIRAADSDDAPELAELLAEAFAESNACFPEPYPPAEAELAVRMQTGEAFLLAECEGDVVGVVRRSEDEGIASFDLLASREAGAGRALVRAVEARAQDGGLRLVRARLPDEIRLADYFAALGYLPIGRASEAFRGEQMAVLTVERRLPLLTVREQRRSDAAAIESLTGEDPWPFEQGPRPGWFVASDGDRVVGVIQARGTGGGLAAIREPALAAGYEGRGLDAWMVERAADYAGTHGSHTAELPLTERTAPLQRLLEDRGWDLERGADRYVKRLSGQLREDAFTD